MSRVLIILTAASRWTQQGGTQRPTGFWAEELVVPHRTLLAQGVEIVLATPGGRPAQLDEGSLAVQVNGGDTAKVEELQAYLDDLTEPLALPVALSEVDPVDYDGVLIPGGHGPMQDLAVDPDVARILEATLPDQTKVVASVCHGPAAFLGAGDEQRWLFAGRRLTAFTDAEETQTGLASGAPWLLEQRLRAAGAEFVAGAPWSSFAVVDGNLVTGQNPASAEAVAEEFLKQLATRARA